MIVGVYVIDVGTWGYVSRFNYIKKITYPNANADATERLFTYPFLQWELFTQGAFLTAGTPF